MINNMENNKIKLLNKIATIRQAIKSLEKDTKGRFDYISEAKLLDIIKDQLQKNNADFGMCGEIKDLQVIRNEKDYTVIFTRQFAFTDLDTGEQELIEFPYIGKQTDPAQALGTAYTYSTRYALMKFFMIANGKDDIDNLPAPEPKQLQEQCNTNATINKINDIVKANRELINTVVRPYLQSKQVAKPQDLNEQQQDELLVLLNG